MFFTTRVQKLEVQTLLIINNGNRTEWSPIRERKRRKRTEQGIDNSFICEIREKKLRPSSDAVPLMCRTKYIFASRSY